MRAALAALVIFAAPVAMAAPVEAQRAVIAELERGFVRIDAEGDRAEGFVVGEERWIVTTLCAVEPAVRAHPSDAWVDVLFESGAARRARVARVDPGRDLALLVVEDGGVPVAPLPLASAPIGVGRVLFAYGSSPGLPGSLVHATVVGRRAGSADHAPDLPDLIRTDGVLGQSVGSPIVDVGGQVVAVSLGRDAADPRVGLSIPVEHVRAFLDAVRASGSQGAPTLAELGVTVEDGPEGVLVTHVEPGSPADRAGVGGTDAPMRISPLRPGVALGVVITELAGAPMRTAAELEVALAACPRGVPIALTVRQGRSPTSLSAHTSFVLDAPLRASAAH